MVWRNECRQAHHLHHQAHARTSPRHHQILASCCGGRGPAPARVPFQGRGSPATRGPDFDPDRGDFILGKSVWRLSFRVRTRSSDGACYTQEWIVDLRPQHELGSPPQMAAPILPAAPAQQVWASTMRTQCCLRCSLLSVPCKCDREDSEDSVTRRLSHPYRTF